MCGSFAVVCVAPSCGGWRVKTRLTGYGGTERLGILPLLVAGYVQLDALLNAGFDIPLWKALLGLFAVIAYASCMVLCRARIRLDLHAVLLSEALERKSRTGQARDRQ